MKIKESRLTKELRIMGLSHDAAAKLLRVSGPTVSKWASGKAMPSPLNTMRLLEIGVSKQTRMNPGELV